MKEFLEIWKSILLGASVSVFARGLVSESESTRQDNVGASVARRVAMWEGGLGALLQRELGHTQLLSGSQLLAFALQDHAQSPPAGTQAFLP